MVSIFIWRETAWCLLIWNSMKCFNLGTEIIKNWSKRKLSEVSKFSISSIGQNWKLGNVGNWHFLLSNRFVKLKLFSLRSFFSVLSFIYYQNISKIKFPEISGVLILVIGQNWKLGYLGNWLFSYWTISWRYRFPLS